ncbi:MAG: hypothetical protein H7255_20960 [Ramlibacter sp.]|nr:hypothetical protein [Ramlibacter sp.]
MTQEEKSAATPHQNHPKSPLAKGHEQKGVTRTGAETRTWAAVNKVQGGGMKISAGRKIPSGPVGGNGRKTNLARSS